MLENKRKIGDSGELIAIGYLQNKWIKIIETNYTIKWWEIDIIGYSDDIYIFIEVKLRNSLKFWIPEEAMTKSKKRSLLKTIYHYCKQKKINPYKIRADFISIINDESWQKITHHENIQLN
jgi:putative endonuclease